MIKFHVNGEEQEFDGDMEMPLLWFLRGDASLKGAKYGCGIAQCGACTVQVNGVAVRSCVMTMASVAEAEVVTIEGLAAGGDLHPVQQAWIELDVPQCGYCQAGQIMAVVDLLERVPDPTDEQINEQVTNICRCGTYYRIRKAIHRAAELKQRMR